MRGQSRPIYLSPHLDDAVLSCGGLIHQQVQRALQPLVITCFAGVPDYRHLSPFAADQHRRWGQPPDPVGQRRHEDRAALAHLGAAFVHLDHLDCIYRRHPLSGEFLYTNEEALWGAVPEVESALVDELVVQLTEVLTACQIRAPTSTHTGQECGSVAGQAHGCVVGQTHRSAPAGVTETHIYAPLAVGQHVDHRLVFQAALCLRRTGFEVRFYEDYPYAEDGQKVTQTLQRWSSPALAAVHGLTQGDLEAKIVAIRLYRSQLAVLFGGESAVAGRVKAYALAVGGNKSYGERYWRGGGY